MKTGTTSLYNYLRSHPQVFMADIKEVNFFNPMRNWRRGIDWYAQQFQDAPEEAEAIGEASTSYTKFPWVRDVPPRIASVLGNVRLIYVIRDPIVRMRSHYIHNLGTGQEWRSIEDAFRKDPMYTNISRYALQIEQYLPVFPRERLLVIESEDLRRDRLGTLRRVFEFLMVDRDWIPPSVDREFYRSVDRRRNPWLRRSLRRVPLADRMTVYVPEPLRKLKHKLTDGLASEELDVSRGTVSDDLRGELREALREDVSRLRSHLGQDFHGWGIG
jgi:hypothetical protein